MPNSLNSNQSSHKLIWIYSVCFDLSIHLVVLANRSLKSTYTDTNNRKNPADFGLPVSSKHVLINAGMVEHHESSPADNEYFLLFFLGFRMYNLFLP